MESDLSMDLVVPAPANFEELPPLVEEGAPEETQANEVQGAPLIPLKRKTPPPRVALSAETLSSGARVLWPSTVPGQAEGERELTAVLAHQPLGMLALAHQTQAVSAKLSPLERAALLDEIADDGAAAVFRAAAATRWRLSLALGTAPAPADPIDKAAFETLTAEIDQTLQDIGALADQTTSQTAHEAIVAVRVALASLGETLGARIHRSAAEAKPARPLVTSAKPPPAKITAIASFPGAAKRRPRSPLVAGLVIAALSVGVCEWILDDDSPSLMQPFEGAPAGMIGMENTATGTILLRTRSHLPPPPEFKDYAEKMTSAGWTVTEREPVGEGSYLLVKSP